MRSKVSQIRRFAGIAAVVASGMFAASAADAAATIVIVNGNAAGVGFNDPTPVAPVGGNPGTTLGQQRLNAFQHAANIWGATLTSAVPVRVLATFEALSCTATGAVLGSAGATQVYSDFPGAAKPATWYSVALVAKLYGDVPDPATPEIRARFNINLGQPGCLTGVPFYLGLDNNHGTAVDLVAVLLHEFGHGLGFQTFTSGSTGVVFAGQPSIWDWYMKDDATNLTWVAMTDAQRAASALNDKLVWTGANVTTDAPSVLSLGVPQLKVAGAAAGASAGLYAVGTASFGPALGSPGVTGDIMPTANAEACTPLSAADALAVRGNIALVSRGTCTFTVKAANVQAAGAIGMIVQDNVAGGPPPGLGGADATIVIPAVRVTLGDGAVIRSALTKRSRSKSGVVGTLNVNGTQYAGADAFGFVKLYAPNPFQAGSSVSHYDVSATRNLLMEPAINADLTHVTVTPFDLTYSLFKDIGW